MFQSCFSYDKEGPFYYQLLETKQEKEKGERIIKKINKEFKPVFRKEWEL